jgi:hypothetical protein
MELEAGPLQREFGQNEINNTSFSFLPSLLSFILLAS